MLHSSFSYCSRMEVLVLFLSVFVCCLISSTLSSNSRGGPQGGLLFPYGDRTGRDGTRYITDYRCEGENMTIGCDIEDGYDRTIEVVRGNFGRFSIAICNQHGHTDWNVNCMSPSTTKRLKTQCDGLKSCTISVDSESFPEDSCPGTFKYLEVHYACTSNTGGVGQKNPPPPPWINPWIGKGPESSNSNSSSASFTSTTPSTPPPRKPILVTDKAQTKRIPITTPKSIAEEESETTLSSPSEKGIQKTTSSSPKKQNPLPMATSSVSPSLKGSLSSFDGSALNSQILSNNNQYQRPRYEQDSIILSRNSHPEEEDEYIRRRHDPRNSPCTPTTARNLQWNWTKRGELSIQQCPIGTTGLARWYCSPEGKWSPEGQPDMSDCKAIAMSNLEAQVRAEDPVNVLISSLAYLTRTKSLYGGDLESSAGIMRTVTNLVQYRFQSSSSSSRRNNREDNKESLVAEVLQNVMRSVSHILEESNAQAWTDLPSERRMKVATSLLLSLEENAFLLAGVMNHPENSLDSSELLTMAIYVVDTRLNPSGAYFPPNQLPYVKDSVYISPEDVVGSGRFNRLAEVVFFSFANLHVVLKDAKMYFTSDDKEEEGNWIINSRVVSASVGRGGRHVELVRPVTITLRHLRSNKSSYFTDPKCVFWNYESHGWSDAGCRVTKSNSTHTVCNCDHLTNFAIAMKENKIISSSPSSAVDTGLMNIIQIVAAVLVSVVILLILFILLFVKFGGNFRKWCGRKNCCNKGLRGNNSNGSSAGNSEMEKCQRNFYTGLSPHSTKVMTSLNDRQAYSQYVLNNHHHQQSSNGGALQQLVGSSSSSSSSSSSGSGAQNGGNSSGSTLSSSTGTEPKTKTLLRASNISSGVPHITLNPYSSQLVENINMMMPAGEKTEVVYRAVSPHGHVYWEIDPQQSSTNHHPQGYYGGDGNVEIEETIRRNNLAESHPLMAFHRSQQQPQRQYHHHHHQQPPLHHHHHLHQQHDPQTQLSTSSTFFNTQPIGNGGFLSNPVSQQQQIVPEQLQRQVQIRDIKSIPVSVKSSEYIEAKIRTLRASHHNANRSLAASTNTLPN